MTARYEGVICRRHPDLRGLRYICNGACVACHRATAAASAQTQERKAKIGRYRRTGAFKARRNAYDRRRRAALADLLT